MRFRLKARLLLGLLSLAGIAPMAKAASQDRREITIFVYNSVRISQAELATAERQATMIFGQAGIATTWVDCTGSRGATNCTQTAGPNRFILHIVAHGRTSTAQVFGSAFLGPDGTGKYSDIFYDRIERMQRESGADPALLLGTVAAHEIGHLLLGFAAHSPTGIMSATWRTEELHRLSMGNLRFNSEEAARMKTRVDNWRRGGENIIVRTAAP